MAKVLAEHEVLEVVQEPFASDSFDVGGRVHVDGHVGEVLVCVEQQLHRFSVSRLS